MLGHGAGFFHRLSHIIIGAWWHIARRAHLSVWVWGVIFLPFAAEEKVEENADDGYDSDAANGAADDGANWGG